MILDLIQCDEPQSSSASHHGFSNSSGSLAIFTPIPPRLGVDLLDSRLGTLTIGVIAVRGDSVRERPGPGFLSVLRILGAVYFVDGPEVRRTYDLGRSPGLPLRC